MRSSDWKYLGSVLIGIGGSLSISGLITFFYFQMYSWITHRYSSYPIPLLFVGICFIVLGIVAFYVSKEKREIMKKKVKLPRQ